MNNQTDNNQTNPSTNYQDILNEYAASVKPESEIDSSSINPSIKAPETKEFLKEINATPIKSPVHPSLIDNLNTEEKKIEEPFNVTENIPQPPENLQNLDQNKSQENELPKDPEQIKQEINRILADEPPKNNPFFKTLFFLSLLLFFGVAAAIAYFVLINPNPKDVNVKTLTTPTITPTETNVICELNGFNYKQGDSFPSADGCNTCTCVSTDNIVCTEKACADVSITPATSSSIKTTLTPTPTNSATTSAVPKDWKTYTNPSYSYSFQYPSNWSVKQNYSGFTDESESVKNMSINLIDSKSTIIMNISIDTVAEKGNISLEKFATQITPLDKVSISQVTSYKIGSLEGVKEMVNFEEEIPGIQSGLRYFVKNTNYYITFSTEESKTSSNVSNILSTFKFN